MELLFIGFGGMAGSIVRFQLGKIIAQKFNSDYPIGTFIINISGAILLGVVTNVTINQNIYLLLADGFLGAYTTFSTFMYEGFTLFRENDKLNAFVYILSTVILGLIGYAFGFAISK